MSNRVTWVQRFNKSKIPRLSAFTDFHPYDPSRVRGLVNASDALLTQADLNGSELDGDWEFGIAHPTAIINASIANLLIALTPEHLQVDDGKSGLAKQ